MATNWQTTNSGTSTTTTATQTWNISIPIVWERKKIVRVGKSKGKPMIKCHLEAMDENTGYFVNFKGTKIIVVRKGKRVYQYILARKRTRQDRGS